MAKKNKNRSTSSNKKKRKLSNVDTDVVAPPSRIEEKKRAADEEERLVTMQALQDMSDDEDDDGTLPPEKEWNKETKALRDSIESGAFDQLVQKLKKAKRGKDKDADEDEESIEEVVLDEDLSAADESEEEYSNSAEESEELEIDEEKDPRKGQKSKQKGPEESEEEDDDDDDDGEGSEINDANPDDEEQDAQKSSKGSAIKEGEEQSSDEEDSEKNDEDDDEQEVEDDEDENPKQMQSNKALHVVTKALVASKKNWPWAETFTVSGSKPLPFADNCKPEQLEEGEEIVDIHDDLKREVAFYDGALAAVHEARAQCEDAQIPFLRPDDFFAEMVKTDEHMSRVKDRLIFETKKMDAVAQRKSHKEQKLRSKEAFAHRLAVKSQRKKDHARAVDDWKVSAAASRGGALDEAAEAANWQKLKNGNGPNKKRMFADKKFGFGGKRGRYKPNDPKTLNDSSSFNPRGNFPGGMKYSAKGGNSQAASGKRPGKRARDASRSKRN